jgi:hypothetical protein
MSLCAGGLMPFSTGVKAYYIDVLAPARQRLSSRVAFVYPSQLGLCPFRVRGGIHCQVETLKGFQHLMKPEATRIIRVFVHII